VAHAVGLATIVSLFTIVQVPKKPPEGDELMDVYIQAFAEMAIGPAIALLFGWVCYLIMIS
jgi:hypothetical protein